MEVFWAFLIVLVVIVFLFVIFPALLPNHRIVATTHAVPSSQAIAARKLDVSAELDKQFTNTQATDVHEDYPQKKIGSCPFSKPHSTDLPLVDVPMCILQKENMRLSSAFCSA